MALPVRTRPKRPWLPWVRLGLMIVAVVGAGWGALELGHRYLGLQKLTIEAITITGCRGERLAELQTLVDARCKGRPLFWFDADGLRRELESRRWVKGLILRRDPPDRLSLVVEERKPLLWLVRTSGVYLISDDGIVVDRASAGTLDPVPVVADPGSQSDEAFVRLIRVATALRDRQLDFYERLAELRWSPKGPVAFLEGLEAPIYLSRQDPTRNIPNFQAIFLEQFSDPAVRARARYFDLRWEVEGGYVAVGNLDLEEAPANEAKTD